MKTAGAAAGAQRRPLRCGDRRRAARRGKVPRQGAHLLPPQCQHAWDPKNQRPELWRVFNTRLAPGESMRVFPISQLDRARHLDLHLLGEASRSCRSISPSQRPVVERSGTLIMVDDDRFRFEPGETAARGDGALPHAGLLSADRRDPIDRRRPALDHHGDAGEPHLRARRPADRQRPASGRWKRRSRRAISDERLRAHPHRPIPISTSGSPSRPTRACCAS